MPERCLQVEMLAVCLWGKSQAVQSFSKTATLLLSWRFLGQRGGAAVGIFTSLWNNSGFDLTELPFPPSDMYFRLVGTLHQGLEWRVACPAMNSEFLPFRLMTVSINTLLLLSSGFHSRGGIKKNKIHRLFYYTGCKIWEAAWKDQGGLWKLLFFPLITLLCLKPSSSPGTPFTPTKPHSHPQCTWSTAMAAVILGPLLS